MGYSLSNGCTGVYFNDNTKILRFGDGKSIKYFERKSAERVDDIAVYTIADHPPVIAKKVLLVKHFHEYLEGRPDDLLDESSNAGQSYRSKVQNSDRQASPSDSLDVYVKKWMRTKHAIMFRLNNKVVQVCFQDKTEIILCSDTKTVTYFNRQS